MMASLGYNKENWSKSLNPYRLVVILILHITYVVHYVFNTPTVYFDQNILKNTHFAKQRNIELFILIPSVQVKVQMACQCPNTHTADYKICICCGSTWACWQAYSCVWASWLLIIGAPSSAGEGKTGSGISGVTSRDECRVDRCGESVPACWLLYGVCWLVLVPCDILVTHWHHAAASAKLEVRHAAHRDSLYWRIHSSLLVAFGVYLFWFSFLSFFFQCL